MGSRAGERARSARPLPPAARRSEALLGPSPQVCRPWPSLIEFCVKSQPPLSLVWCRLARPVFDQGERMSRLKSRHIYVAALAVAVVGGAVGVHALAVGGNGRA